jgi:hypothetical protein
MLQRAWDLNVTLRRAFLASLALHALIAFFLPTWTRLQSDGFQPVFPISVSRIATIRIARAQHTESRPAVTPHTHTHSQQIRSTRAHTELSRNRPHATATPEPMNGARNAVAAAPTYVPANSSSFAGAPSQQERVAAPTPQTQASPTPAPDSTAGERDVAAPGKRSSGGLLPFGASMAEPVLDPNVRDRLAQRFKVHVTLIVTVGDDGKTKQVRFDPPIDPDTERQIEALLADANWDPAVCGGGIACEATANIKL